MNRIFVALCVLCLSGEFLAASDWPQFLGPTRNAISTETGLLQTWPEKGPPLLWEREVGQAYSGPVVAGGRLILFHRIGDNEVVECLDAANGKERWKFDYPTRYEDDLGKGNGPRSTPLVAGNRVYTLGAEGRLHCLELESGKKVWERSLMDEYRPRKGFFGVGTSPLLEGNHLLINVGGKGAGVVAFHKDTGKEVWKATDQEASYSSPTAATIDGVRHVIFLTREGILSLDPATGAVRFSKRWRSRMHASVNAATPLVVGDQLFVSACYDTGAVLHKVRKDSIEQVWANDESLSNQYNTSIHRDGFLYGIHGRQDFREAKLRCVELKTGKVRWTREAIGCGSMVLADRHLILLEEGGDLVLIEATPDAYKEKARATVLGKPCFPEIALANGRLYARDGKKLICLNLKK
jgi:outer membrane protein assembly factor BamB